MPVSSHGGGRLSSALISTDPPVALPKRGLTEETCRKWGYAPATYRGETVQVATYRSPKTGERVGQKIRTRDKNFSFLGDLKESGLYGQHMWKDGGRRVIVTEGEIDAMSVSQVLSHRWPVVSLPNGASAGKKALARELQWLLNFEEIVLCFDMDDPGREATAECVCLFPPGRVRLVVLPSGFKDPSEMLMAGEDGALIRALWDAAAYRPDGIVTIEDIEEAVMTPPSKDLSWWCSGLDGATYGRRYGEAVALGAGTGIGKSDFMAQQIAHDLNNGIPVGVFAFEQHPVETVQRVAGKMKGKLFHVPNSGWTKEELAAAVKDLKEGAPLYLYDHFGACDWGIVAQRIRFLHHSNGVRVFYLDHLTALAAEANDERVALEKIMAEIGSLVKELGIWLLFVSHLSTPDGKPHEEGGRVMIRHFKGSRTIGYWSHFMLGLERDQQSGDQSESNVTVLRVLKDRYTGRATGATYALAYDRDTGILKERNDCFTVVEENNDF